MIHTILVPLDGTEFSEQALPTAMAIARRTGARVRLARVHAAMTPAEALLGQSPDAARYELERQTLDRLAGEMTAGGVPTDTSVLDGPAAQALAEHADAVGAGLVVMTTHGRGPIARAFLGSVSVQLLRLLTIPTLLVRPTEADGVAPRPGHARHLLIALDGTPAAEAMLLTAAELGEAMGARLTLLRVAEPVVTFHMYPPDGITYGDSDQEATDQLRRLSREYLERLAEPLRRRGLVVATRVAVHPNPAEAILTEARDLGCDLIALESRGRTGLSRLLLGSVADAVVRDGATPVLTHSATA